jgi:hypothetical protein
MERSPPQFKDKSDTAKPEVYDRQSKPFNKAWEEWVVAWWRWCFADRSGMSPAEDKNGDFCAMNQNISHVWFLAGTFGGRARRKCIVRGERSIFFPIVNDLISFAEYSDLMNEEELRRYAKMDLDTTNVLTCSVDNVNIDNLQRYRVQSDLFDISIPVKQRHKKTMAISDGYWIFLKSLSTGPHNIFFKGEKSLYDNMQYTGYKGDHGVFKVEVQYDILVE